MLDRLQHRVAGFGGTTPYVVTWLTAHTGNVMVPAFYLIGATAVSLATVLVLRATASTPLRAATPSL
jgi:MHS family proline/betaine transporter-like MFS transporter